MRVYLAGALTALTFVLVYFFVGRMRSQLEGFGTEIPKYMEVIIATTNIAIHYFYVSLPLLFFFFKFVAGLFIAGKPEAED